VTAAGPRRAPPLPRREAELAPPVRRHLERLGYAVWVDPDGSGFFDIAARRGEEILLVELKRTDWRELLRQAVARRGYADRVAVALPRRSLAERLLARSGAGTARCVGVFVVDVRGGEIVELRPAEPWPESTRALFARGRQELGALLDGLASGGLPPGVGWGGFPQRPAHRPGGRAAREWRLDEFPEPDGAAVPR
jgi:hypothetical protein